MLIHPTALIHPSAQLGHNVEIGEYAVVRAEVTIGDDCIIQSHAVLTSHVTLGRRNLVGHGTVIGSAPQDRAFDKLLQSSVHIGDDNEIREHVTIHRGTKEGSITSVGNGNMLMTGVHLGHNVQMGHRNIIANNALFAGYVDIADDVTVGGGSVFHQFIRVGRMAMIRGGTAWSKDIPPFCVGLRINTLGGLNAIGMRRKGIDQAGRNEVKKLYQAFFRGDQNVTQALDSVPPPITDAGQEFLDFIRIRSKRGLCRTHLPHKAAAELTEDPILD